MSCNHLFINSLCDDSPARKACNLYHLLRSAEGLQVDSELLALLVEVAALEAKGACDVGHMKIVAADFAEQHFAFECFGPLE